MNPDEFDRYTIARADELERENAPYEGMDNFWLGAGRFFRELVADGQRRRDPDPKVRSIQQAKDEARAELERRIIEGR
jgi:hypothetical protein